MNATLQIPQYADTVVIGGGTAGAAVAGLLAARGDRSVLLLEAGPDYGHQTVKAGGRPSYWTVVSLPALTTGRSRARRLTVNRDMYCSVPR